MSNKVTRTNHDERQFDRIEGPARAVRDNEDIWADADGDGEAPRTQWEAIEEAVRQITRY